MTRTTIRKSLIMGLLLSMITVSQSQNTAEKIIGSNQGLHIGGYGCISFTFSIIKECNLISYL